MPPISLSPIITAIVREVLSNRRSDTFRVCHSMIAHQNPFLTERVNGQSLMMASWGGGLD
jgi:hypothetical protein